jgi:2-pyrone-4,6-dicarboxylate lactonase
MTDLPSAFQTSPRPCPGPDPEPHGPRSFQVPRGAVDTHAHVIGAPPDYPLAPDRSYTAPQAPPEAYLRMLDATGMTYGVLVQVSAHGTDNRLMLQTLKAHPDRLRGIGVMPLGLPVRAYEDARDAGVVGLRLNVLYGGGIGFDALETTARWLKTWDGTFSSSSMCGNCRRWLRALKNCRCPL